MRGEFHIHTTYSDGALNVDEILEFLKGKLDYFSIQIMIILMEASKLLIKRKIIVLKL